MAIVTRYFSDSAAGAGDGTSWADRAAFVSGGTVSTVITGFNFAGSDSLRCLVEGGKSYSVTTTPTFANAPTTTNPLFLFACDSTGALWEPPDPDWTSDTPAWSDAGMVTYATTTNISSLNIMGGCHVRGFKFTASGRNDKMLDVGFLEWCIVEQNTSNTGADGIDAATATTIVNSVFRCTQASYNSCINHAGNVPLIVDNVRLEGVSGSSGNRRGLSTSAFAPPLTARRITSIGHGGHGIFVDGGASSNLIENCVVYGCGGDGMNVQRSAGQQSVLLRNNFVVGSGGYGINLADAVGGYIKNNRIRHSTNANYTGTANYPVEGNLETESGSQATDDAAEFVDAANGDFRIKAGSDYHGLGLGVSDEPEETGGGETGPVVYPSFL